MIILNTLRIMKITVCRKAHFNSAHKLANNNWSKEKNYDIFGKCSYENYHGHNYEVVVSLKGNINPETGLQEFGIGSAFQKLRRNLVKSLT